MIIKYATHLSKGKMLDYKRRKMLSGTGDDVSLVEKNLLKR